MGARYYYANCNPSNYTDPTGLLDATDDWGMRLGGGGGGGGFGPGGGVGGGAALATILRSMSDQIFFRYLESIQSEAAVAGHATRSIQHSRIILDEALRMGYRFIRPGEEAWIRGRHGHLISPAGQKIHFPSPPGFAP